MRNLTGSRLKKKTGHPFPDGPSGRGLRGLAYFALSATERFS